MKYIILMTLFVTGCKTYTELPEIPKTSHLKKNELENINGFILRDGRDCHYLATVGPNDEVILIKIKNFDCND